MKTQTRVYEGLIMARKKESTENNKNKKANKVKKNNSVDTMLHYTARDYGQEYIMKRKMIRAIFIAIMLAIALIVFIALYMDQAGRVQETYRTKYTKSLETVVFDLDDYKNAEADYELRYRMILADMSNANAFAFLLDDFEKEQKSINGLYTCFLKYPQQMQQRIDEVKEILEKILNVNNKDSYEGIDKFVDTINLKGY
ncbi:hypothetical protein SAMN02745111_01951 [Eubacterium uniforme]|uniref:Uncharacterized protein n=2 Tax=Eubacterium uniforme TaxID=39495 RepID=A0A1T4VYS7_9FIRM|nr:hypothetical protein SAMN02745111_01951 [Eubacterium uniforme]